MIVYLFFFIDIFYKIKKYNVQKKIIILLISTFSLSIIFALFMFTSADGENLGTSGSDTLFYYKTALDIVNNPYLLFGYFTQHSGAFIVLISATLLTMPSDSSFILIFLNLITFIDVLLTLYLYLKKKEIKEAKEIIIVLALSGGMMMVGIQILKDMFLLFLFIEILFLNIIKPSIVTTLFLLILTNYTRPHIWIIILPLVLLDYKINKELIRDKYVKSLFKTFYLILMFLAISIFYFIFQDFIELFLKIANETALRDMGNYGSTLSGDFLLNLPLYLKLPISMIKFILLPLPLATLRSNEPNLLIKILYVTQAIVFHFFLLSILLSFGKLKYDSRKIISLILYAFFLTIVYSLIYLGNADMRLRLPMIVVVTIIGVIATRKLLQKKENINILMMLSIVYLSVPSLYKYLEYMETIKRSIILSIYIGVFLLIYYKIKEHKENKI